MPGKLKVIVNAIPLANVNTGIGRYIRSLYSEIESRFSDRIEIGYFDGSRVRSRMPDGPADLGRWSGLARLFWKLPPGLAYAVRRARHALLEHRFMKAARGYDVYHETAFFPFAAPPGTATVFTIHDLSLVRHPQWHPAERVRYFNAFFPRRLGLADAFIAVSEFTRNEMVELLGLRAGNIHVVLQGAARMFSPRTRDQVRRVRERRGLPERYFLFVGSGDPRKNAALIPRALQCAGLDIPLVSVGWSGWGGGGGTGVIPLGFAPDEDLAALYSGALALVFPSGYEGFGLPVLEAMACGCPVVAANRASLPEVGGDAALWIEDLENPEELGRVLASLAEDETLRNKLSGLGLARARNFAWETFAEQTFNILSSARAGKGRGA